MVKIKSLCLIVGPAALAGCSLLSSNLPMDAGTNPDASQMDASQMDASQGSQGDASQADMAQVGPDMATTCSPADVSAFTPTVINPGGPLGQNRCSPMQINDFFTNCSTAGAQCDTWKASNTDCYNCAVTPETASTWGAFVDGTSGRFTNYFACLDMFQAGCGSSYNAWNGCVVAACDNNPACASADGATIQSCESKAAKGGCKAYTTGFTTNCGNALADSTTPASQKCFQQSGESTMQFHTRFLTEVCGPP